MFVLFCLILSALLLLFQRWLIENARESKATLTRARSTHNLILHIYLLRPFFDSLWFFFGIFIIASVIFNFLLTAFFAGTTAQTKVLYLFCFAMHLLFAIVHFVHKLWKQCTEGKQQWKIVFENRQCKVELLKNNEMQEIVLRIYECVKKTRSEINANSLEKKKFSFQIRKNARNNLFLLFLSLNEEIQTDRFAATQ